MLEEANSDVLLLYDCCHSAATTISPSISGHAGVTEVISACGFDTIAPPVCEHSFSRALTQILACASQGSAFSVGELHMRVLKGLMCWTPPLQQDHSGRLLKEQDGTLAFERQPRRTPIHTIVCETEPRRSMIIAPFEPPSSLQKTESPDVLSSELTAASSTPGGHEQAPCLKLKRVGEEQLKEPQVLIAIQLEKDGFDREVWIEWLHLAPAECKDIKIDGRYGSFSTLLLLRMPVATWNLLPNNSAYSFVGFVTSENTAWEVTILDELTVENLSCFNPATAQRLKSTEGDSASVRNLCCDATEPPGTPGSELEEPWSSTRNDAEHDSISTTSAFMKYLSSEIFRIKSYLLDPSSNPVAPSSTDVAVIKGMETFKCVRPAFPGAPLSVASTPITDIRPPFWNSSITDSSDMLGIAQKEAYDTARDHPLYKRVTPKLDGLYHCPWEGQDGCMHKPHKLKCNY